MAPLLLAALLTFAATVQAHTDDIRFRTWSIEQGLSQSTVTAILQDHHGFLWFGTQDGLNRFDAHEFTIYKHDPNDPNSLLDNSIRALAEDARGRIWIATAGGGLNIFSPTESSFQRIVSDRDDEKSLLDNQVWSIYFDQENAAWIGTGRGLHRIDPDSLTVERIPLIEDGEPVVRGVYAIQPDEEGRLYLGTGEGLRRFDPRDGSQEIIPLPGVRGVSSVKALFVDSDQTLWAGSDLLALFHLTPEGKATGTRLPGVNGRPGLERLMVRSILRDNSGTLWVATSDGLFIEDSTQGDWVRYGRNSIDPFSLPVEDVRTLLLDQVGTVWVGTGGGGACQYNRLLGSFHHLYNIPFDSNSLASNMVTALLPQSDGSLWVGLDGDGLDRVTKHGNIVRHFRHDPENPSSLPSDHVWALAKLKDGSLFIGTFGAGIARYLPSSNKFVNYRTSREEPGHNSGDYVASICQDRDGILWIGTLGGGVLLFDPGTNRYVRRYQPGEHGLRSGIVRNVLLNHSGQIWLGTDGGIHLYNAAGDSFTTIQYNPNDSNSLSNNRVMTLYEDDEGYLWAGTLRGGLNRIDLGTMTITRITEEEGLPNNVVYGILGGVDGALWLSTNEGLAHLDRKTLQITHYTREDGLQSNEFNEGAYAGCEDGNLYFGGVGGVTWFHPDLIPPLELNPPVTLTDFEVLGQPHSMKAVVWEANKIRLSYKENYFSFEFAALNYTNPARTHYSYMLSGYDPIWVEAGSRRYASYTHVPPGRYRFLVRASDGMDADAPPDLSVAVTVIPPFWMTWWFRLIALVAIVSIILLIVIARERAERARLRKLELLVAERTSELELAMEQLEQAKEAELEAQRLKTLNQLAATIAHEFNNPLGIIQGFCDLTQIERSTDQKLRERMERVNMQVQRMHSLVRKLLRLRTLREIDYAAGLKILDVHGESGPSPEVPGEESPPEDISSSDPPE